MRGIFYCLLAALLLPAAACGGSPAAQGDVGGNLTLRRDAPHAAGLLDAPVRARYCARDSILWLVAVDRHWSAAIALRTAHPYATHYEVTSRLGGAASATIGARDIGDSIRPAVTSLHGTVELERSPLAGRFSFETGDSAKQRFSGSFKAERADTNGCGAQ
jgi:hypothetical protein